MEVDSLLQLESAISDALMSSSKPPSDTLVVFKSRFVGHDDSESDNSDGESPYNHEHVQIRDLFDDALEEQAHDKDRDVTMDHTSNAKDTGKLSGYSDHPQVNKMFDDYTGADNDDFIHQMIEDYSTKGKTTDGNPTGLVLTKFNGERATRRFIATALKLEGANADKWMNQNFRAAWEHFDVNRQGSIEENMLPSYFRSLLGDYSAQFNLRDEDRFLNSLRNHA